MSGPGFKPFYHEGIRFECQGTGRCCTSRGEYGYVYLEPDDERRLAEALGLETEVFRERYCDVTDGYLHLKHPELDCLFLDGTRCGVYEARPEQCRTWPFWPENLTDLRTWNEDVVSFCPGVGVGKLHTLEDIRATMRRRRDV